MNTIINSIEKIMPSLTFAQELALFYENESSKIKIVANIGVGLACAGAIIHIFSGDASKYFLMIPIGIVLLQISIAYYRMRSFIDANNREHRGDGSEIMDKRLEKSEARIILNIQNQISTLQTNVDIEPSDSVSQILVMEDYSHLPSLVTTLQNTTFTTT